MTSDVRYTSHSRFGPSLEWDALPAVGAPRRRRWGRALFWIIAPFAIAGVWIALAVALLG